MNSTDLLICPICNAPLFNVHERNLGCHHSCERPEIRQRVGSFSEWDTGDYGIAKVGPGFVISQPVIQALMAEYKRLGRQLTVEESFEVSQRYVDTGRWSSGEPNSVP